MASPTATPRSKAPVVVAAVVGLLLVLLVRQLASGGGDDGDKASGDATPKPREGCTQLSLVMSSEKAALVREIAADYADDDGEAGGTCVDVTVTSKASGGAMEALARGWDEAIDGPRPDVWSPASTAWTTLLEQRTAAQDRPDLVPDELPAIAQSPLVIAMPRPMAQALGWPAKEIGWSDVLSLVNDPQGWGRFGHPEWGRFKLGKTNPNFSTSGLHALVGTYFAATQRSSDLSERDLADARVQAFVKGVESGVVHYGDTTLTFLDNLLKADDAGQGLSYISAATIEEKSVWDYNQGNPKGDPAELGKHAPPKTPLVAIYPKEGTLLSDNPYTVLTAEWVDDAKRAAAADFLAYLQGKDAQQRFTDAAFRDFEGKTGRRITQDNGLLAEQPKVTLGPPAPVVLDKLLKGWTSLRKPARVLVVIDVSGSMGEPVPKAGTTKLELAKRAAIAALGQFAPNDEIGLWVFSTDLDGPRPYRPLIPIAPASTNLARMRQTIGNLVAEGGTALYASTRAAVATMRAQFDPTRINAVVLLTDGRNEYPADTDIEGLLRELRSESTSTGVRVFPIAYGDDADLTVLRRMAEAARAAAYDASDPATIDKVLTAVISNF